MSTLGPEEVLELIGAGDDASLVGCLETESVDFKGTYALDQNPRDPWELAKDAAAMANRGGGVIVVGVITEVDPDRAEERAVEVQPVPEAMFDPKRVRDIVRQYVYPSLRVDPVRHRRSDAGVIGTIRVLPSPEQEPYLLTKMPDPTDRLTDSTFGWPVRTGTDTHWRRVGEIHEQLRLPGLAPASRSDGVEEVDVHAELSAVEEGMQWTDRSVVFLVARPAIVAAEPPVDFYANAGAKGVFRDPPEIRMHGFGLIYSHEPTTTLAGAMVDSDSERYLEIRPTGLVIAALGAGPHFLNRSQLADDDRPGPRPVNPIVLSEWTHLFLRVLHDRLSSSFGGEWTVTMGVHGAVSRRRSLQVFPGPWTGRLSVGFMPDDQLAGLDDWSVDRVLDGNIDAVGYELLQAFYGLFGVDLEVLKITEDGLLTSESIIEAASRP